MLGFIFIFDLHLRVYNGPINNPKKLTVTINPKQMATYRSKLTQWS